MTVSAGTTKTTQVCDGNLTDFDFSFAIYKEEDIAIILKHVATEVETVLVLNTDYTIASDDFADGGTVSTIKEVDAEMVPYAWSADYSITIMLSLDLVQETDLLYGGNFSSEAIELTVDRLTRIAQQLDEKINRTLKLRKTSALTNIEIDDLEAGKFVIVNADGDALEMGTVAGEVGQSPISNDPYSKTGWAGITDIAPSKNVIRNELANNRFTKGSTYSMILALNSGDFGTLPISNNAYGVSWEDQFSLAPSQNALFDKFESVGAGDGDVKGPATNTIEYVPQWLTADSKELKNGFPITDLGKTLVADITAAAMRSTLGLSSAALRAAEDVLTDGSNLPDGHAIKTYGNANWGGLWADHDTYIDANNNPGKFKIYDTGITYLDIDAPNIGTGVSGSAVLHWWGLNVTNSNQSLTEHETVVLVEGYNTTSTTKNKIALMCSQKGSAGNNKLWTLNPIMQLNDTWNGYNACCAEFDINRNCAGGTYVNGIVVTGSSTYDLDSALNVSMGDTGKWEIALGATDFNKGILMNQAASKSGNLIDMQHDGTQRFVVNSAGDVSLFGESQYKMAGGVYAITTGGTDFRVLSTGSTALCANSYGLRKSLWSFFATDTDDVDEMIMELNIVQTSGEAQRAKTGIKISHYSMPDNGGDVSGLLSLETGGGSAITCYKAHTLRPGGYANYHASEQGALECGTADQSQAGLFMSGMVTWGDHTNAAECIWCRIDNEESKGILVSPSNDTFDTRQAFAVGSINRNSSADSNLKFVVELTGTIMHSGDHGMNNAQHIYMKNNAGTYRSMAHFTAADQLYIGWGLGSGKLLVNIDGGMKTLSIDGSGFVKAA